MYSTASTPVDTQSISIRIPRYQNSSTRTMHPPVSSKDSKKRGGWGNFCYKHFLPQINTFLSPPPFPKKGKHKAKEFFKCSNTLPFPARLAGRHMAAATNQKTCIGPGNPKREGRQGSGVGREKGPPFVKRWGLTTLVGSTFCGFSKNAKAKCQNARMHICHSGLSERSVLSVKF